MKDIRTLKKKRFNYKEIIEPGDDYFEIGEGELVEAYRVTGYDRQSTPGVEYVSIDPIYVYDHSPKPEPQPGDNLNDFYWLNGGES